MPTVTFPGKSGLRYPFEVFSLNADWNDVPGLYIFAHQSSPGRWTAHYVGQTDSFKNRFSNHHKWPHARMMGATHILARVNGRGMDDRCAEERDLIQACQPSCNDLLKH